MSPEEINEWYKIANYTWMIHSVTLVVLMIAGIFVH
jgi:hypothetical protein